jgi:hypothetical protein
MSVGGIPLKAGVPELAHVAPCSTDGRTEHLLGDNLDRKRVIGFPRHLDGPVQARVLKLHRLVISGPEGGLTSNDVLWRAYLNELKHGS